MLEYVHRVLAGLVVGPLVLVVLGLCVARRRVRPDLVGWSVLLAVLLVVQAKLGGITVFDANSPWSVALHLGNALVLLAVMARLFAATGQAADATVGEGPRLVAAAAWLAVLLTMVVAAVTAKSGASLACATWPSCNGVWVPSLEDPLVRLHFLHRSLAAVAAVLVLLLLAVAWRSGGRQLRRVLLLLPGLFAVQVAWGALVVVLAVPVWTAVVHQATGVALFVVLSYVVAQLSMAPRPTCLPEAADVRA